MMFSILGATTSHELLLNNSALAQDNHWGKELKLQEYCERTKGGQLQGNFNPVDHDVIKVEAQPNRFNPRGVRAAFRWACVSTVQDKNNGTIVRDVTREIDTQQACKMLYGENYRARAGDENNPYSWYCTRD